MDTNEWAVDELGIYWRLLLSEWVNGSIPNDEKRLARISGCGTKKFQKGWTTIKVKFQLNGNGRFQNKKMEEVREMQRKYSELQSEKGKKSADIRINRGSTVVDHSVQPEGQPEVNSSSSSSSSDIKEKIIYSPNSDEFRLSEMLLLFIQERDPKIKKPDLQKWADHIERLIRLDGRTPEEIEAVIKWCQADLFWCVNILSTSKLREKFSALKQKMEKPDGKKYGIVDGPSPYGIR